MPEHLFNPADQQNIIDQLPSGIELSRNSKGYTWTIKLRCRDGDEKNLLNRVVELDQEIRGKFANP